MGRYRIGRRDQRRARRREAGWHGSYALPEHPDLGPGSCRVLDVSRTGVGLELYGPWPRTGRDEALLVQIDPGEGGGGYELAGRVRNRTRTKFGFVRVGVEFVALTPEQHAYLQSLAGGKPVKA